jgi:thiamine pyrophosphokinase
VNADAGASRAPTGRLAVVFLGGAYEDVAYYRAWARSADHVVAADGGAAFLTAQGIRPDVVVGDFDSLTAADVERLADDGVAIVRYPTHKDATDGELAVEEALRRGAGEVVLVGALGALDHTLGHLAILRRLGARGVVSRLAAPRLTVAVFAASEGASLDAVPRTRVSLVPLDGDAVVTLEGLDYPLTHGLLPGDACLGLGNAVQSATATIAVHKGVVAVLVESGDETFGRPGAGRPGAGATGAAR